MTATDVAVTAIIAFSSTIAGSLFSAWLMNRTRYAKNAKEGETIINACIFGTIRWMLTVLSFGSFGWGVFIIFKCSQKGLAISREEVLLIATLFSQVQMFVTCQVFKAVIALVDWQCGLHKIDRDKVEPSFAATFRAK